MANNNASTLGTSGPSRGLPGTGPLLTEPTRTNEPAPREVPPHGPDRRTVPPDPRQPSVPGEDPDPIPLPHGPGTDQPLPPIVGGSAA
jgi:hypothetical protein